MSKLNIHQYDVITLGRLDPPRTVVLCVCEDPEIFGGDGQSVAEFSADANGQVFTVRVTSPHEGVMTRWSAPTWRLADGAASNVFEDVEFLGWQHGSALQSLADALGR